MNMHTLLDRITADPNICFGKPCIKGTRIWVSLILDFLATGSSIDDILEAYPHIKEEDIYACITYGSAMSLEHYVNINIAVA